MADFEYPVVENDGQCVGYVKMTALSASTGLLSIPNGATRAIIQCEGYDVRWRADAVAPTATDGMMLAANAERSFSCDLSKLRFIQCGAGAVLHVSYFK